MTNEPEPAPGEPDLLLRLQEQISAIEAGAEHLAAAAAEARAAARARALDWPPRPPKTEWNGSNYPGAPEGDDWLNNIHPFYRDGEKSCDLRLSRELAAVGVRCYSLQQLHVYADGEPRAVPIFADWLADLEEKIPGPETEHRDMMRKQLILKLTSPAAYGHQGAIAALIAQLRRKPSLAEDLQWSAGVALEKIAGTENYDEIMSLYAELTSDSPCAALLPYLGRAKTPEAVQIAVDELGNPGTRQWAIRALIEAEADSTLPLIARYADDESEQVRDWVKIAMEQLE